MIGILVEVAISWIILRYATKKNLHALGLIPNKKTALEFALGFAMSATICVFYFQLQMQLSGGHWKLNESFGFYDFLASFWWVAKSVLFEEFIFRGAILYVLIRRIGLSKACWLSAVAFGVYHWFSYGIIGNPQQMFFVFLLTGTWGLMFAYSFAKTQSMLLPIALHLGWNSINLIVFSQGTIGDQLLVGVGGEMLNGITSLGVFVLQWLGLPLILFIYFRFWNYPTK